MYLFVECDISKSNKLLCSCPFKVDVDLAKIQAQKPPEDDEVLRKKLWLRIARHVVEEERDVKKY